MNAPRKLTKEELVDLVRRIVAAEGTEEEQDDMMDLLEANVADPEVSDLIYYPPSGVALTPEQIVERALAYRPIQLPP